MSDMSIIYLLMPWRPWPRASADILLYSDPKLYPFHTMYKGTKLKVHMYLEMHR